MTAEGRKDCFFSSSLLLLLFLLFVGCAGEIMDVYRTSLVSQEKRKGKIILEKVTLALAKEQLSISLIETVVEDSCKICNATTLTNRQHHFCPTDRLARGLFLMGARKIQWLAKIIWKDIKGVLLCQNTEMVNSGFNFTTGPDHNKKNTIECLDKPNVKKNWQALYKKGMEETCVWKSHVRQSPKSPLHYKYELLPQLCPPVLVTGRFFQGLGAVLLISRNLKLWHVRDRAFPGLFWHCHFLLVWLEKALVRILLPW